MPGLADFRDRHRGEAIIVCGCGESLRELTHPERYITIGVNDVGRLFQPTYLVVVNPRRQFTQDRYKYVESSKAEYLFSQLDLGLPHQNVVRFQLGKPGGTDLSDPNVLHYTQNSPYVALCLAAHLGAKRIGLIGVDFTDHHFFGKTGRHVLAHQFPQIDAEYRKLRETLAQRGVAVVNLSGISRLTSIPKMEIEEFAAATANRDAGADERAVEKGRSRIFFVHYRFVCCGDVFKEGLHHAAQDMGLECAHAYWDDPRLSEKIRSFGPDLLFVIHGWNFSKRWGNRFSNYNTAVWLLDEPYIVDGTSAFSNNFRTVFVNDPATVHLHKNAHYLPVCFDPNLYAPLKEEKKYHVGFIGAATVARRDFLKKLNAEGLLSYVVGGPWSDEGLRKKCLSGNISHAQVAHLYQQSRIVLNVFRDVHQYNRKKIAAYAMNPRIYEALACGALVVSERRPEIEAVFPELPMFEDAAGMVAAVRDLLGDAERYEAIREACYARLRGHTYRDRLREVLRITCRQQHRSDTEKEHSMKPPANHAAVPVSENASHGMERWEHFGITPQQQREGVLSLQREHTRAPGSERGFVSTQRYSDVKLEFDVKLLDNVCFIAKIRQGDKCDQLTNSYHLMCNGTHAYFARHSHVFKSMTLDQNAWERICMAAHDGIVTLSRNGMPVCTINDTLLKSGYAFLGIKGGTVHLRNIHLDGTLAQEEPGLRSRSLNGIEFEVLQDGRLSETPIVSIITTVYDRTQCLEACLRSVEKLNFQSYEHIIVADAPPSDVGRAIAALVGRESTGRLAFANLKKRHNDWGIAPASIGLHLARGKYVSFLSDDNGYTPEHFDHLVPVLEREDDVGFVYSSCDYAGRLRLNHPRPAPGRIDLGQPLFRRNLFAKYLQGTLPFHEFAWDWRMIESFIQKGVRWRHVDRTSFLFRLASCHRMADV